MVWTSVLRKVFEFVLAVAPHGRLRVRHMAAADDLSRHGAVGFVRLLHGEVDRIAFIHPTKPALHGAMLLCKHLVSMRPHTRPLL